MFLSCLRSDLVLGVPSLDERGVIRHHCNALLDLRTFEYCSDKFQNDYIPLDMTYIYKEEIRLPLLQLWEDCPLTEGRDWT